MIIMPGSELRLKISTAFKMHGLSLKSDASKYLDEVLSALNSINKKRKDPFANDEELENNEQKLLIDKIIDAVLKQPLSSTMISKEHVKKAANDCLEDYNKTGKEIKVMTVIDAFSMPKYTYNQDRKKFIANSILGITPPSLFPKANSKALVFQERYSILYQLVSRHELFTPAILGASNDDNIKKFQLFPIEYLLGTTSKISNLVVLGIISNIEEGKYHIEDPTGAVAVNLSQAQYHTGIITENNFVLAEGWYEDDIFYATGIGLPPIENASTTRSYFGNINFCGIDEAYFKSSNKLSHIEKQDKESMMVILSEVWLDKIEVMQKLKMLFNGYSNFPPVCFILIGNFISNPHDAANKSLCQNCFKQLGDLIGEYPLLLEKSTFVFVPGPNDLGLKGILPRPPIPNCVTEDFRQKVPKTFFTTNPARIQYCTQEIVIFREDLLSKVGRHCLNFPTGDVQTHFVKTILSQVHLCPVPLHAQPIYWEYDHALRLYPLPELVIFADDVDAYKTSMAGSNFLNPGSFSKSEYIFKVYMPADRTIEDSQIIEADD